MSYNIKDFHRGDRVEMHPGTDQWMMGARFGTVRRVGKQTLRVKLDRMKRTLTVGPRHIGDIIESGQ